MTLLKSKRSPVRVENGVAVERVHLIGVGGTGLRGMAAILAKRGLAVSGSEAAESPVLRVLEDQGIHCTVGHQEENLPPGTQLVLVSAAVDEENPEVQEALRRRIPILKYAEFLGLLMNDRPGIAVAGTHGKTTTTSMITQGLIDAGEDPGFIVGGDYPAIGGSASWGSGRFFVAEACEFDRSFLNLYPTFAVITNIEEDHLDYFSSLFEIQEAFMEFVGHLPRVGYLVLNGDDPHSHLLARHAPCAIGRFSLRAGCGDWWAEALSPRAGGIHFEAASRSGDRVAISLRVPGVHNVRNALALIVLLRRLGIPLPTIVRSLESFRGVKRRFEILLSQPVVVIDDYAHHPTEIEMVLRAARETFPRRRLRTIFQPHQYSRTYRFLNGFAQVLAGTDEVVVTDVFAARDSVEDIKRIDATALVDEVNLHGGSAYYSRDFDSIVEYARSTSRAGDVFLCLGAGDITCLAGRLSEELQEAVEEVA